MSTNESDMGSKPVEPAIDVRGSTKSFVRSRRYLHRWSQQIEKFIEIVKKSLAQDEYEIGDYSRTLQQVNLHGGQKALNIHPSQGGPEPRCVFPKDLRQIAVQAIDHHVTVSGRMKYRQNHDHPYEMEVRDIEIHPADAELPNLLELRGIAPGATGDLKSEEFIRKIRNEWSQD